MTVNDTEFIKLMKVYNHIEKAYNDFFELRQMEMVDYDDWGAEDDFVFGDIAYSSYVGLNSKLTDLYTTIKYIKENVHLRNKIKQ